MVENSKYIETFHPPSLFRLESLSGQKQDISLKFVILATKCIQNYYLTPSTFICFTK